MATIKSCTDLEQSRKLAEILSHDTADQTYATIAIAGANFDIPEEQLYRHNGDMPFIFYSGTGIPCWSLFALLNILPSGKALIQDKETFRYKVICKNTDSCFYDNPVDACYEMILKLNELNLL